MLDRLAMNAELQDVRAVQFYAPEMAGQAASSGNWQLETVAPSWPDGLTPLDDHDYAGAMLALER
jgi:hypothetical protein